MPKIKFKDLQNIFFWFVYQKYPVNIFFSYTLQKKLNVNNFFAKKLKKKQKVLMPNNKEIDYY